MYIKMYDYKEFLKLEQSRKFIQNKETIEYYIINFEGKKHQVDIVKDLEKISSRDLLIRFININRDKFEGIKEVKAYENKEDVNSLYIDLITIDNENFNLEITYYNDSKIVYKDIHDKYKVRNKKFSVIKLRADMIYYDTYKELTEVIDIANKEFISVCEFLALTSKKCVLKIRIDRSESKNGYGKGIIFVVDEDLNEVQYELTVKLI